MTSLKYLVRLWRLAPQITATIIEPYFFEFEHRRIAALDAMAPNIFGSTESLYVHFQYLLDYTENRFRNNAHQPSRSRLLSIDQEWTNWDSRTHNTGHWMILSPLCCVSRARGRLRGLHSHAAFYKHAYAKVWRGNNTVKACIKLGVYIASRREK